MRLFPRSRSRSAKNGVKSVPYRYRRRSKAFAPATVAMLRQLIAPLMQWRNIRGLGDAYALDLLMTRAQIAVLREEVPAARAT